MSFNSAGSLVARTNYRAKRHDGCGPALEVLVDLRMLLWSAVLAGLGVALGAFGAHALRQRLDGARLAIFETGVRYQMYHALALFGVAAAVVRLPGSALPVIAGWCFVVGTLLFSGSLYLLAITNRRALGAITPIGGLVFLMGWLSLIVAALRALTMVL